MKPSNPGRRLLCSSWLVTVILLSWASPLRAGEGLRKELELVADGITKVVKEFGYDTIAVGEFTGPPELAASGGAVITLTLTEELHKKGLAVQRRAPIGLKGEFRDVKDKTTGLLAAQIKGAVTDRSGKVLFTFDRGVFGAETVASLFGATGDLPPDLNEKETSEKLEKHLDNPKVHVAGTKVSATASSPYAVEILVAPHSVAALQPRAAKVEQGLAFVGIRRGEVYGIRLINNTAHDAAVTLTIDGLSIFTFSDARDAKTKQPKFARVIVPAKASVVIKGWHRTNEVSEEFLVTEYAKSAAGSLGSTAKLGTITASFSAAWAKGGNPPADEPTGPTRSVDATGRGAQVKEKYFEVEREIGVVREVVSVRYTRPAK
jgi:hypothetical protein